MFNGVFSFLRDLLKNRSIIMDLAARDVQQQNKGAYLGFVWVFLQPLLFVSMLYMIFTLGFKVGTSGDMPFSLYLICGIVAWLYFSENLVSSTNVIMAHSFLVKKIDFRLSVLPIVKLLSSMLPHIFLLFVAISLAWYQGYRPGLYTLQLIYYCLSVQLLLLGICWLTSSTAVFVKDVSKLVAVIAQFGFWLTPIFWNIDMVPDKYQWVFRYNPANYIVTGYRDSIVGQVWFWDRPEETLYFWLTTVVVLVLGINVYKRLKPHFAEVV